jgi:rare lipoprotein A (peptidoglycan hydrolase)
MVKGSPLTFSPIGMSGTTSETNERKYVLRNQNTIRHRSIKAAAFTAALACVLATGVEVRSSGAAQLTYFHSNGKLHLVNTDRNGGLQGIASVYHDRITANGEHMNPNAMTAAHKSLPMGSRVTVFNHRNGRSVTVRINDRGPYVTGRVIDLSPGAARVLGVDGLAQVSLHVNGRSS